MNKTNIPGLEPNVSPRAHEPKCPSAQLSSVPRPKFPGAQESPSSQVPKCPSAQVPRSSVTRPKCPGRSPWVPTSQITQVPKKGYIVRFGQCSVFLIPINKRQPLEISVGASRWGRCTVVNSAPIVKRSWNQEKYTLPWPCTQVNNPEAQPNIPRDLFIHGHRGPYRGVPPPPRPPKKI
jgi:hypothetical protein